MLVPAETPRSVITFVNGRSPGSRLECLFHLPGFPSGLETNSPFTVAGAASELNRFPLTINTSAKNTQALVVPQGIILRFYDNLNFLIDLRQILYRLQTMFLPIIISRHLQAQSIIMNCKITI